MVFVYVTRKSTSNIELYIDKGFAKGHLNEHEDFGKQNLEIFEYFYSKKDEIESSFKTKLVWEKLENRRACRISFVVDGGYNSNKDKWPKIHEKLVNNMISFSDSLKPLIKKIK